jgi:tetratricopeptide (TPR) repeat protein
MKPALLSLLLAALLSGCATLPGSQAPAPQPKAPAPTQAQAPDEDKDDEPQASLPRVELTPKLLYSLLLAEIAGQRGQVISSAEIYRDIARETRDPRIARRAAEMALHGRRLDTALEAGRLWQELDPDSPQARQMMIRLLVAQNNFAELRGAIAASLAAEPPHLARNIAHLNRLFARSQDRKAVRALIEAVTEPYLQLPEAHYARALAAFDMRDLAAARAAVRRALQIRPDWETAALLHVQLIDNRAEALAALGEFVAAYPQARDARLAYARALVNERRYAEARREFAALLEQGAGDPARYGDIVFAVAVLSLQLKDTAEAERHLRRLVDIGHAEADKARLHLGQIAADGKRWAEALKWFSQVGRGEHYLTARLQGAGVLAQQGDMEAARRYLAESEAATPRERAQLLIGEAQLLREAGRTADAHAALAAGLARDPDQPELLYEVALLDEKLGRIDEMERRLRRLIELRPDHAHAHNALGYSLADRNLRLDEAHRLIERALELAPNDPFILDSKGWLLFRQGQPQAALEVLNTAFAIRPDPEIAAHLGEVLWMLGRRDEARATLEKARQEHPANETVAATLKRLLP